MVERVSAACRCVLLVHLLEKGMEVGRGGTYYESVVALAATCSAAAGEVGGLFGGEVVCHCFCRSLVVCRMFLILIMIMHEEI